MTCIRKSKLKIWGTSTTIVHHIQQLVTGGVISKYLTAMRYMGITNGNETQSDAKDFNFETSVINGVE